MTTLIIIYIVGLLLCLLALLIGVVGAEGKISLADLLVSIMMSLTSWIGLLTILFAAFAYRTWMERVVVWRR